MRKKIICYLFICVFLIMSNISVSAANTEKSGGDIIEELYEEFTYEQQIGETELQLDDEKSMLASYIDNMMNSNAEYSKSYGGVHLKDGNVTVMLTEEDSAVFSFIENNIESSIVYKQCDVSLEELEAINEYILDYLQYFTMTENEALNEMVESIVTTAIYVDQNVVSVGIKECSSDKVDLFKKHIIDSENVVFRDSESFVNQVSYVKPGDKIYVLINGTASPYSMGFRCKRLYSTGIYVYGFVTAAHGGVQDGYKVYSRNLDEIGHVWGRSYANGGTVDAVFVQMINANYDCSNTIYQNGRTLSTSVKTLSVGDTVAKAGYKTGVTQGEITSTSASGIGCDGIQTRDMYEAEYHSDNGDSGGIVYSPSDNRIVGIHKGQSNNELYPFRYAIKAANIRSALGLTLY